jgi:MFS family permease
MKLDQRIGRNPTFMLGTIAMIAGLIIIFYTALIPSTILFYAGLILFGIGGGVFSVPGLAYMLDICASFPNITTTLIAFCGIVIASSRSIASITTGILLLVTGETYAVVFFVETLFAVLLFLPLQTFRRQISIAQ